MDTWMISLYISFQSQDISLLISYGYLDSFIAIFHMDTWMISLYISFQCQDISLLISYGYLDSFIAIFHMDTRMVSLYISFQSQDISLRYFIWIPGRFHCDISYGWFHYIFHFNPRIFHCDISYGYLDSFIAIFHMDTWMVSLYISFQSQDVSLRYFIWIPGRFHCDISYGYLDDFIIYFILIPGYFIAYFI